MPQEQGQGGPRGGVPVRALTVGAIGVAAAAVVVTQAEMVLSSVRVGYLQFPPVALGLMLIVVAISRGLKRLWARLGLTSSDLLVVYTMMLVGAMVSSHGIVQKWIPLLVAMKYGQNSANNWDKDFDPHIPARLVPWDPHDPGKQNVVEWFYNRLPRGEAIPWGPWIVPLLNWGILVGLIVFAFLCLTTILRRQWVDNEKLSFPLAQLPLEIAGDEEQHTFFRNRLMWLGALIPIVVYGVNGVHQSMPSVPKIPLELVINDYLTAPPYNGLAYTALIFSFAAIGFFFLLPTDVIFSIWFFFVLSRFEQLVAISYNMDTPGMPIYPPPLFIGYQTIGAYLVLVGYFFWIARPHLAKVWAAAIGRERVDDSQELMPYRVAVWGLLGAILASSVWLYSIGMSLWLALFELVIFIFVTAVVMARSTAEAGMLMTETTFRPIDIFRMFGSIHALGPANLTALAFFDNMFLRDQRGLILTGLLDGVRISDGTNFRRRSFVGVFALGIVIALIVSGALNIALPYHLGATRMDNWMAILSPQETFQDYAPYFSPNPPLINGADWQMPTFFGVGVLVTILLTLMRSAFAWWPLHPLGYALAGSWSTVEFWFPCLLAWIIKSLSLRYGGMGFYQKARPFFLGLVLGEFGIAVFFVLLNMVSAWINPAAKIPPPPFPWG
jgi:hypothetical protein